MKRHDLHDIPMWEDPNEPAFVREMLQAGRRLDAGYDVDRGLAKHLAMISGSSSAPAAAGAAIAKSGLPGWLGSWLGFVAAPLVAAGVAGLLWVFSGPSAPSAPASNKLEAAAPAVAAGTDPAAVAAPRTAAAEIPTEDAVPERRVPRASGRSHAPPRAADGHGVSRAPEGRAPSRATRAPSESMPLGGASDTPSSSDDLEARGGADTLAANPYLNERENEAPQSAEPVARSAPRVDEDEPKAPAESEAVAPARAERTQGSPSEPEPVIDDSRLEREMQMLAVTQRVLQSDPARALRLSQQGEREFRGSMLSAERRQLGLLALVKLGRLDEARRAGRPFLARYPKAPWSERLRRALASGKVE